MSDDGKMLDKIAKLLAQAEGTNNADEAAAFTEMAQKLATMYAVDLEIARYRAANKDAREELTTRRVSVGEPGRQHKNRFWSDLALAIAAANDIRCTIAGDNSAIWAYGYPSDIDVLERLFASLNVQMVDGANRALRDGEHKKLGVHGRTFRPNFYDGFVREMGMRLFTARADALIERKRQDEEIAARFVATAADEPEETTMTGALVMVKKSEAVSDYYNKTNNARGSYRSYGATTRNSAAAGMGRAAARNASLGGGAGALGGGKKAIG